MSSRACKAIRHGARLRELRVHALDPGGNVCQGNASAGKNCPASILLLVGALLVVGCDWGGGQTNKKRADDLRDDTYFLDCPVGTLPMGPRTPMAPEWCERADGTRHGPAVTKSTFRGKNGGVGWLTTQGRYHQGKKHGAWTTTTALGTIVRVEQYAQGVLERVDRYALRRSDGYEHGRLNWTRTYHQCVRTQASVLRLEERSRPALLIIGAGQQGDPDLQRLRSALEQIGYAVTTVYRAGQSKAHPLPDEPDQTECDVSWSRYALVVRWGPGQAPAPEACQRDPMRRGRPPQKAITPNRQRSRAAGKHRSPP